MQKRALQTLTSSFSHFAVGSLPYKDPKKAVQFIFERPWLVPFCPELPQKSAQELMLPKFERGLSSDWKGYSQDEASGMYAIKEHVLASGKKLPLIKTQLIGPYTALNFSSKLTGDFTKRLSLARDVCVKQLQWTKQFLSPLNSALLCVLDEPALARWMQLSTDEHNQINNCYSYLFTRASEMGVYLGLHSCGIHKDVFLDLPFELYSFDAVRRKYVSIFAEGKARLWKAALKRGMVFAAGVYPIKPRGANSPQAEHQRGLESLKMIKSNIPEIGGHLLGATSCGLAYSNEDWFNLTYTQEV